MVSPIAMLRKEHQRMLHMAEAAEALAARMENKQSVPAEVLLAVCDFFSLFAHYLHHDKEEELLFPRLRARGMRESGCIAPLLADHEDARAAFVALQQAANDCTTGDRGAVSRWVKAARFYCDRLRYHVRREEIVLTNAEQTLPAAEHAELTWEFARLGEKSRRAGVAERIDAAEKVVLGAAFD